MSASHVSALSAAELARVDRGNDEYSRSEILRLLATIDALKVRAEIAEGETERQRERTRRAESDLEELRATIGEWSAASELQVENVFALLKGYPKAVAVLRKAIR